MRVGQVWSAFTLAFAHIARPAASISGIGSGTAIPRPGQIAKPGETALEGQLDRADRTVALLAQDDLGLAMHLLLL